MTLVDNQVPHLSATVPFVNWCWLIVGGACRIRTGVFLIEGQAALSCLAQRAVRVWVVPVEGFEPTLASF